MNRFARWLLLLSNVEATWRQEPDCRRGISTGTPGNAMKASKSSICGRETQFCQSKERTHRRPDAPMSVLDQIETGTFATPGWVIFPPDSVRVVSWNIDRGLQLDKIIDFLTGAKADILLLQ